MTALREKGRDEEATAVSQAALRLPWDHGIPQHQRWLALEAALSAPLAEAAPVVATAPEDDAAIERFVVAMARAALALCSEEVPPALRPGLVRGLIDEADSTGKLDRSRLAARVRQRLLDLARARGVDLP